MRFTLTCAVTLCAAGPWAMGPAPAGGPVAVPAQFAQQRQMGGIGITVFADSDYRGRNATFRDDVPDLGRVDMNDVIGSLQVAPGETWEVCEHSNYRGRCQIFSGEEPSLRRRGWSDVISSMRRVSGGGGMRPPYYPPPTTPEYGLELFARRQYGGDRRLVTGPVADLSALGFNDRAQSLRLPSSQSWEVCVDAYFRNCRAVNTDSPDLDRLGLRERISSARPLGQSGGVYPAPAASIRLILYDERRYRGRSFTIEGPMSELPGFNDRAESLQVAGGHWEVCDERQFRGRCVTVTSSVPDLRRMGLRNRVASARPLPMPR